MVCEGNKNKLGLPGAERGGHMKGTKKKKNTITSEAQILFLFGQHGFLEWRTWRSNSYKTPYTTELNLSLRALKVTKLFLAPCP